MKICSCALFNFNLNGHSVCLEYLYTGREGFLKEAKSGIAEYALDLCHAARCPAS